MTSLRAAPDVKASEWVVAGLRGFGESVLSLVPAGFPSYVRVFHPAYRPAGAKIVPVRWSEIAVATGAVAHPAMQSGALTGSYDSLHDAMPGVFEAAPSVGSLPPDLASPIAAALARHTTTPDRCWFAVWDGFGGLEGGVSQAPVFGAPYREYHLLTGPVEAAAEIDAAPPGEQSPNLWWPEDCAWCVATEIDLNTTYIGCDETCRDGLLSLTEIEAMAIEPSAGIDFRSDLLNPVDEPTTR